MRTLALDPVTGDLAVAAGKTSLLDGTDAIAQRLRCRLALWRGDYVLDQSLGIPFADLLGRKGRAPGLLKADLRAAALSSPGIAALRSFTFDLDASRHATVALAAQATTGEPIDLGPFQAGA